MMYMRNITITTAKSATYLENVGPCASTSKSCTGRTAAKADRSLGSGDRRRQSEVRPVQAGNPDPMSHQRDHGALDRTSVGSGKGVSVRVDLGGRRIIKKKK